MNTAFFPKVSIIIPVYNGANYMREAIDSALAQTYTNIEVVVVNDGSRDDGATREVALSYGDRIRYIEKENGGVSSALNRGIREMTGEYFSWLSHDDRYEPDKIARQVSHLAEIEDRDKLIAMCGGFYLDKDSKRLRDMDFHFKSGAVNTGMEVLDYLLTHGVLDMCCLLIPRETFEDCAYFHEDLRYNQDALILYQIFSRGYRMVTFTEERDVAYRLHVAQTSKTRRDLLIRELGPLEGKKILVIGNGQMGRLAAEILQQAQDLLGVGSEGRMNTPSSVGKNWRWRALPGSFTPQLAAKVRANMELFRRLPE